MKDLQMNLLASPQLTICSRLLAQQADGGIMIESTSCWFVSSSSAALHLCFLLLLLGPIMLFHSGNDETHVVLLVDHGHCCWLVRVTGAPFMHLAQAACYLLGRQCHTHACCWKEAI